MENSGIISAKQDLLPSLPDPIFQTWLAPVSEEFPCGEDISFSDGFESLKEEVEKEVSLHGGQSTDWAFVLRMATQILGKKSKDLWVLCYGVVAAHETQGFVCCAAALSALSALLDSCWDELHPKPVRIQRRIAPLRWLASRFEAKISAVVHENEKAAIIALKKELIGLQTILDSKIGDKAPAFANLLQLPAEEIRDKAPLGSSQCSPSGNIPQTSCPSAFPHSCADDLLAAIDGDGRVPAAVLPRLLRSTQDQCRQLATHFASCDPLDWRVILLHRAALWCTVTQLPQADAAGVTMLRSIPSDRAQLYSAAVENKRYMEVFPQLERSVAQAPFWLDGHHLVARCLEGLGVVSSLVVLRAIIAQFLQSFPELLRYKFQDGTPFASPRTSQWLESLESPLSAHAAPRNSSSGAGAVREQELLDESLAIWAERGFQAGLSHLERIPAGRSRASVRQGVLLARYCIAARNKKAGVRLLQALYAQLEKWELLDWEPELSADIISLLISSQPKERGPGAEIMLSRLHWLHLGAAVGSFKES